MGSLCRAFVSKSLVPYRKSKVPRLSCPSATVIIPHDVVVRDDVAVSINPPGTRLEAVACEMESMPLSGLPDVHAEVADDPTGDYLYERQKHPSEKSDLLSGWQVLLRTRGFGVDEARGGVQEDNVSLRILCCKMVKC